MHLGNARTALIAWLSARAQGGRVVLRMDDIDAPRVVPGAATKIMEDFARLGLDWDEGPDVGGSAGPYEQSHRTQIYRHALDQLQQHDLCFPCGCSRADLARAASAPHQGDEGPHYPGTCRTLPREQVIGQSQARGKEVAWRFRSDPKLVSFVDALAGHVSGKADDFVLWRADGLPSYQLAVVVDDAAMGVTEVVRGDDLLSSGVRQIALYQSLGLSPPAFAHVPLVLAPTYERLAKRNRPPSVADILQRGVSVSALVGALAASAGLCPPGTRACPRDLLAGFSLSKINRGAVVIDPQTLEAHTQ